MWFVVQVVSLADLPYEDSCLSHLPKGHSLELFSGVFLNNVLVFWYTANDKTPDEVRKGLKLRQ